MIDDEPPANRLESLVLTLIFAAISVALLVAIGWATKTGSTTAGWWTRPALAPGAALLILTGANIATLIRAMVDLRQNPLTADERLDARAQFIGWLKPIEFLAYFAGYLGLLPHLGYVLATLVFILFLMLRVGLRSRGWLLAGAATALALMLIFRVGLGVWMPAPAFLDLAPEGVRSTLMRWL